MLIVIIGGVAAVILSGVLGVAACMLSSLISREEEQRKERGQ